MVELLEHLFWVYIQSYNTAEVSDIYRMEFKVFQSSAWVVLLNLSVLGLGDALLDGGWHLHHLHAR